MARNEEPARSTVQVAIVFTVSMLLGPSSAHAQLLDRASSAARGDSGSQDRSDDRSSDDDDGSSSSIDDDGVLGSASRSARGGSRGTSSGGSSGGGSGSSGWEGPPVHRARASVPYSVAVVGVGIESGEVPDVPVAARLELEGGYVIAGAGRIGAGARLELPWFDLAARYSLFLEPRDSGWDAVALGRIGLDWRAVDEEPVVVRIGAGLRHFEDAAGGLFGADVVLGVDLFLGPPVILSLELGGGFVGEAFLAQARGSVGFAVDACELYVGYDFEGLWSGGGGVDLGGPMLGIRGWL